MTNINDLKLSSTVTESTWIRNIVDTNATAGVPIIPAIAEYTHIIKSLLINSDGSNKWIEICDGEDVIIGPFALNKNVPLLIEFPSAEPIYLTAGNALVLKTEAEFIVHLLITGRTIPPPLENASNPTPSNEATGVNVNVELQWDSFPQVESSTVYLGKSAGSLSPYVAATLLPETTYYWRVDDSDGNKTLTGDVWSFTTA